MEYYAHVTGPTSTLGDDLQDYVLQSLISLGAPGPDGVTPISVWADVPQVIRTQVGAVKDRPRTEALAAAPVLYPDWGEDEGALPNVHANLRFQCPDGLVPWSDNPGEEGFMLWPYLSEVTWQFVDSEHRPDDDMVRRD